ncbi:MAG: permease [Anaerolineae bacterium]
MTTVTVLLGALALAMLAYAWRRGDGSHRRGVAQGWQTLRRTLPLLVVAFAIVGYVDVLAPQRLVQAWIGPESGWQGLVLGEAAGMILPGGPYVVFPLIAGLYRAGAGLGPAVALITAWAMGALLTISFEVPFLGWRFTAVRWGLGLAFPLLAGLVAQVVFGG